MIALKKSSNKAMLSFLHQGINISIVAALSMVNIVIHLEPVASQDSHHSAPDSTNTQDHHSSPTTSDRKQDASPRTIRKQYNPSLNPPLQQVDITEEEIDHFDVPTLTSREREVEQVLNQGLEKLSKKDYQGALQDFNKVLLMDVEHERTYRLRGDLHRQMKDYKAAVKDYTQAIKLNPSYWSNYVNRGEVYEIVGNYHPAIGDYSKAIELYPEDGVGYSHRGAVQARLGNYEVAMKDFENAIAINPARAEAFLNRGNLYVKLGNIAKYGGDARESAMLYEKAIVDYQQAAKLFSEQGYVAELAEARKLSQAVKQRLIPTQATR